MTVVCKVLNCEYRSQNGFCKRKVVPINAGGVCEYLHKRNIGILEYPIYWDVYQPGIGEERHALYARLTEILASAAQEVSNNE